jgi:hypothetical protein
MTRKLATIIAANVVGYARLTGADEAVEFPSVVEACSA